MAFFLENTLFLAGAIVFHIQRFVSFQNGRFQILRPIWLVQECLRPLLTPFMHYLFHTLPALHHIRWRG